MHKEMTDPKNAGDGPSTGPRYQTHLFERRCHERILAERYESAYSAPGRFHDAYFQGLGQAQQAIAVRHIGY